MGRVGGHSGLREEIELRQIEEKAAKTREKRAEQKKVICGVLDKMPETERMALLADICKMYRRDTNGRNQKSNVG